MGTIKRNFIYNVIYQILLIILPLITTPYVSRVLGANGIGVYSYTYTVANYFVLLAMLGVKNYGNRSIAAVRENQSQLSETFWEIYALQFLCAAFCIVLYVGMVVGGVFQYTEIALIQGLYVISAMFDISWLFFGLEQFKITVSRNIVIKLINLACIFIFVKNENDLWKYVFILAMGMLASQICLWCYIKRFVVWKRPVWQNMKTHIYSELILFIPIIAVSLYKMMDKIMLGQMSDMNQVGYYENTEKIMMIPMGVITALGTVMLPRMSNLAAKGKTAKSRQYIYNSILFAVFMSSAMVFGIAGIAETMIPIFLGSQFLPCITLLKIMCPSILFIAWANVIRTQYLIPNKMDKSYIISVSLGAVINLAVNLALIPRYHAMGATVGTLCAEIGVCICQTWMVRHHLEIREYLKSCLPFLFSGMSMYGILYMISVCVEVTVKGLLIEVICGGTSYIILSLFCYKFFQKRRIYQKES